MHRKDASRQLLGVARSRWPFVFSVLLCIGASVHRLSAQQAPPDTAYQNSQERLTEIRRQREQLQGEMDRLRGRVHDLSGELNNIERQVALSGRVVGELDIQVEAMGSQIDRTTADLIVAEDALTEKRAILQHRLIEITKRGPLYTFQVLLAAETFGDLLSRYKYLYLASRQDRQLVTDVEDLRNRVADSRDSLLHRRSTLADLRDERAEETQRLQDLEQQRERSLHDSQREQARMQQRMEQLARDETRITNLVAVLERRRRAAAAAAAASRTAPPPAPSRIRTSDIGSFDWPVTGDIVYNFGRAPGPGNTVIRWTGIGISATVGTPVKVIAAGTVRMVNQLGTFGLCVVVDHGGGYYSLYCNLDNADVRQDQAVERGAVIGRTGGENSDQGPHLHFEIRGSDGLAIDPVQWLRHRG
jgi:septal ring factor EnvC (AmiA/AmiB activator)